MDPVNGSGPDAHTRQAESIRRNDGRGRASPVSVSQLRVDVPFEVRRLGGLLSGVW